MNNDTRTPPQVLTVTAVTFGKTTYRVKIHFSETSRRQNQA